MRTTDLPYFQSSFGFEKGMKLGTGVEGEDTGKREDSS
jgi:hypothetical protein